MKVYTVWSGQYEDIEFQGVFSSIEKAEKFVRENWQEWYTKCWIEYEIIDEKSQEGWIRGWKIEGYSEKEKRLIPNTNVV